jgi:hypothetical protein
MCVTINCIASDHLLTSIVDLTVANEFTDLKMQFNAYLSDIVLKWRFI